MANPTSQSPPTTTSARTGPLQHRTIHCYGKGRWSRTVAVRAAQPKAVGRWPSTQMCLCAGRPAVRTRIQRQPSSYGRLAMSGRIMGVEDSVLVYSVVKESPGFDDEASLHAITTALTHAVSERVSKS